MPSLNTGNAILSNAIAVDSSYNVGIGGAASGSFKLQVTGTTNLTGALTGTSAALTSTLSAMATNIQFNLDGTFGANYYTMGFGGVSNGFNRIAGGTGTTDGLYILAATGRDIVFRTNGSGSNVLVLASTGAATFSSSVGVGGAPSGTYGTLSVFGGISTKDDNNGKLEIGRYSSGAPNSYIKIGTNSGSLRITNAADTIDLVSFFNSGFTFFGTIPSATNYIKYNFNVGTDQNIGFRSSSSIARLEATNDAVNANVPMEFAASKFIFTGGNIGIGVNPTQSAPLTFADALGQKILLNNNANNYRVDLVANVSGGDAMMKFIAGSSTAGEVGFYTTSNLRMLITSGGRVGIENSAPQGKLEVGRTASNTTSGGHFFSSFLVPVNTWTTIFYAPNNNWNAITEFTWTSSGDYNRSGAAYMRWAYGAGDTLAVVYTLFNNSQNADASFRNSGGEIQIFITGGAVSYHVQVRIQGSQAA